MAEQNFTEESVFRFLRTNLSGFTRDETDSLENYVTGLGIKGYKRWQQRWIRRLKTTTEEDLELFNHCRVQMVEKVDGLMFVLKQRKKTVRDITMALYEFMVKENLQVRLKEREEAFQAKGEQALAREYAQIYRIVIELFDKFVELLGDEPVSLKEYGKLLDAGWKRQGWSDPAKSGSGGGGRHAKNQAERYKALIFVGANDAWLPGNLLRDRPFVGKRPGQIYQGKDPLAPGGKERTYEQKFYLYLNLTKPSEKLDIFYSKVSSDGKSLRPSYLIQEIRKLYPDLVVTDEETIGFAEREWTEMLGMKEWIRGIQDVRNGVLSMDGWMELYRRYRKDPAWQEEVERLLDAGFYRRTSEILTGETASRLYGEKFEDSITRIERFSACAFSHFLTYGLRLRERETYDFQAVDLGNICHGALERFSEKVEHSGKDWIRLTGEEREAYIDASVEEDGD